MICNTLVCNIYTYTYLLAADLQTQAQGGLLRGGSVRGVELVVREMPLKKVLKTAKLNLTLVAYTEGERLLRRVLQYRQIAVDRYREM
jgi:hypothetical protein